MSLDLIRQARDAGRHDEVLRLLLEAFERVDAGVAEPQLDFVVTFHWQLLMDDGYAPAREAMVRVRNEQLARLLAGELSFGAAGQVWPRSRFQVILTMNERLKDSRSSYDTFIKLLEIAPEVADRHASRVLQVMVDIGDYTLAESYLGNPLEELDRLNQHARQLPLYPPRGQAPRMWGDLQNFLERVTLLMAVHRGLGREAEAQALRDAALVGLESEELRTLAERELAEPGLMYREIGEYLSRSEA